MPESEPSSDTKRVSAKGRRRAAALLDAARAVLASNGYAGLSLRTVAERAHVRLGHLQYYFPSKQALLHATIERELDRLAIRIEARAHGTKDSPAGDDPFSTLLVGLLAEQRHGETLRLFGELRALALGDTAIANMLRGYFARYWRVVVGAVLAANPALGRARAERRGALIVALLEGLNLFRSPSEPRALPLLGLERELGDITARLLEA